MHDSVDFPTEGDRDAGDRLFAESRAPLPARRGFTPPLIAGLAAATLFAAVLGFFMMPTTSIGFAPDDSRTRWTGAVRALGPATVAPSAESAPVKPDAPQRPPVALALGEPAPASVGPGTPVTHAAGTEVVALAGSPAAAATTVAVAGGPAVAAGTDTAPRKTPRPDPVVARVQSLLAGFGYEVGPADGLAGRLTWSAIERFRLDRGLRLDEPLTLALVDELETARDAGWRPTPDGPGGSLTAGRGAAGEPAVAAADGDAPAVADTTLQRVPGLRVLAAAERHVLERWCTSGRNAADLDGYYGCLSESLQALQGQGPLPEFDRFDAARVAALRGDCQAGQHAAEPSAYFACVRRGLADLLPVDGDARRPPIAAPETLGTVIASVEREPAGAIVVAPPPVGVQTPR